MAKSAKSKSKSKFFTVEDTDIYAVDKLYFEDIKTREIAIVIAVNIYDQIQQTLIDESLHPEVGDSYIGNMKLTTGFQRSLDELDKRWPYLMYEVLALSAKNGRRCVNSGRKINNC